MSGGAGYVLSRGRISVFNNVFTYFTIFLPRQSPCEDWPPRVWPTPASARLITTRERRMWRWGSVSRTWACSAQTAGTTWASSGGWSHCQSYVLMFCNIFSAQVPPVSSLPPPEPAAVARPRLLVLALPQTSWDAGQQTVSFVLTSWHGWLHDLLFWSMINFLIWWSICWFDYPFPDFMNS